MVKEFRIELAPPPQVGYFVNSDVTGHVVLVIDEANSGYKAIEITLKGYGVVNWSETRGSGDDRRTVSSILTKNTSPTLLFFGVKIQLPAARSNQGL